MKLLITFFIFAISAFASEANDLERTVQKWKKPLHMDGWDITIKPAPSILIEMLMGKKDVSAMSSWDVKSKTGIIFVTMRSDYTPELKRKAKIKNVKKDQRDSVVHEMLHNVIGNMQEESAIVTITSILKP